MKYLKFTPLGFKDIWIKNLMLWQRLISFKSSDLGLLVNRGFNLILFL